MSWMEFINCSDCKKCLASGGRLKPHGPYEYHREPASDGSGQRRRYGPGTGGSSGATVGATVAAGTTTALADLSGTGRNGALSYYDYASGHLWGEEPLTEEEAISRREELRKTVEKHVAAAERRLQRPLSSDEVSAVVRVERDAMSALASLTPEQSGKLREVLDGQKDLKRLTREKNDAIRSEAEKPGMTARMISLANKEVEAQFATEMKEVKKQIRESKVELKKMLDASE